MDELLEVVSIVQYKSLEILAYLTMLEVVCIFNWFAIRLEMVFVFDFSGHCVINFDLRK